jgi:hypothetical protein
MEAVMDRKAHYITPAAMDILERYPAVFGRGPWTLDKTPLGWGFTCGPGWHPILDRLFSDIQKIAQEDVLLKLEVQQVKEKFGGLRVYVRGGNGRIQDRIAQAEEEAAKTCEGCGGPSPGVNGRAGWLSNICDSCVAKKERLK